MSNMTLPDGVVPPVLTPLTPDQQVDVPAFRQLLRKLLDAGIPALFVGGTAGLGSVLTATEYAKLIAAALDEVPDGYPVLCGVLESSTARALERIRLLEQLGARTFVTVAPFYCRASGQEQLLRHFGDQREATAMEMVVYNIPVCVGVQIPAETIVEMARRGWIRSCKDSSGDNAYFGTLCRKGADVGLRVYQGMHPDFAWLAEIGAVGCVPVPANVCPEVFIRAWEQRRHAETIARLQAECDAVWEALVKGTDFTSQAIAGLAEQEIGSGTLALPFG